jgi:hypothetical protein
MRVGLYYDQTFKARFGSDSIPAMRRVLAQVKEKITNKFKLHL